MDNITNEKLEDTSEIVLSDKESGIKTKLKINKINNPDDFSFTVRPTDEIMITRTRLNNLKEILRRYLDNPDDVKPISVPTIRRLELENGILELYLSPYNSEMMMRYACTVLEIATDNKFPASSIVFTRAFHKLDKQEEIKLNLQELGNTAGVHRDYFVRVKYGGGGVFSGYSDFRTFQYSHSTLPAPVLKEVEASAYKYIEKPPYSASVSLESEPYQNVSNLKHTSTTWKIYTLENGQYTQVWTREKSVNELTNINLVGLIPKPLKFGVDYYVTVTYNVNDGRYTHESNKVKINFDKIATLPVKNLMLYPNVLDLSNPQITFDPELPLRINNIVDKLDDSGLIGYTWKLISESGSRTFKTTNNFLQLPERALQPDTTYELRVYYEHTNVGESVETIKVFKTEKEFKKNTDGLIFPLRIADRMALFGELKADSLMRGNIKYRGLYDPKEHYNVGDEVNKDGELYICRTKKESDEAAFEFYFTKPDSIYGKQFYKSGLPTYKWLLDELGFNPYLGAKSHPTDEDINNDPIKSKYLYPETGTWLKTQNCKGRIVYISKFAVYNGISHNDLIRMDLFHPKRKTIRIGTNLYYVRLLTGLLQSYYDAIDPIKKDKINTVYGSRLIDYKEDKLIGNLLNNKLGSYSSGDLDISLVEYKEIMYNSKRLVSCKIETTSGAAEYTQRDVNEPDERIYSFRLALELIPPSEYPIKFINKDLPGNDPTIDENGNIEGYEPFIDYCYLGTVDVDQFITSGSINEKTGLYANGVSNILAWHKVYYKGLIYYIPQGSHFINTNLKPFEDLNVITPTPLYVGDRSNTQPGAVKHGKMVFNNFIFNLSFPDVVNMDNLHQIQRTPTSTNYDIFNGTSNRFLWLSEKSLWSNFVYRVVKDKEDTGDGIVFPKENEVGYKGKRLNISNEYKMLNYIGPVGDINTWIISRQRAVDNNGELKYILTNSYNPYIMKQLTNRDKINVSLILSIVPTVGNLEIWNEKK